MHKEISASVVAITNLYPLPWEPTRASFNKQQFEMLSETVDLRIFVFVPLLTWIKHRKMAVNTSKIRYAPYFHIPKFGSILTPFFQYLTLKFNASWILKTNPSAIYACWLYPDAIASAKFAKEFGIRCIGNAHGTDVNYHASNPTKVKQILAKRSVFKYVFCPSKALKKRLVEIGFESDKVVANYNGVNRSIFFPETNLPDNRQIKRILFVGSLIKTKGIFELISAFNQIKKNIECELFIVGQGLHSKDLKIARLKSPEHQSIHLLGALPLEKVAEQMRIADLLVLPSYREGLPNVILEAFASGTPVVATTVGGIPEVITTETGILTEPQSIDGLVGALTSALNRSWDRALIAQHSEQFDWSVNVNAVLDKLITHDD